MKSIYPNGILEHVLNRHDEDGEIIRKWILDGAPLTNETFQQSQTEDEHVNIISHQAFKFQY